MATIKPFRALRPDPFYADQLVFPPNDQIFFFGIGEKTLPLKPLKEQLESPARQRPETEEGQQLAYREIRDNIETLKELQRISLDGKPGIYIYEIVHREYRQTGIWALTSIKDYTNGHIKIHEQTLADSERRICNYRKYTGLEGSPILLTYEPNRTINRIIAETCSSQKRSTIGSKKSLHRIWKIDNANEIKELMAAFAKIGQVYLTDGHHRLAATSKLAQETNTDALISSLYIASDQLRIIDYHRVVIPEFPVYAPDLLKQLESIGNITPVNTAKPTKGVIGMCLENRWYELQLKDNSSLDVVALQEQILSPLFQLIDPRTDKRLKCVGGEYAMEELNGILKAVPAAIGFTLCPMTVTDLMTAATANQILPPKSTWIDPKVPYGLLMYQHSFSGKDISAQHLDKPIQK